MSTEDSVDVLKAFLKQNLKMLDPSLAEALKKAIEIMIIEVSKQKAKENKK